MMVMPPGPTAMWSMFEWPCPAIVEQLDVGPVEQLFQAGAHPDLAIAALLPDAGARRIVG